jgi:hypothetical protein
MGEKNCGVCQKKVAEFTCSVCGVALCAECVREVAIENPGQRVLGVLTSPLKSGMKKQKVCEKCMKEVDFVE